MKFKKYFVVLIWVLTFGAFLIQGCAPVAHESSPPDHQIVFEPTLTDREINFDQLASIPLFYEAGKETIVTGAQIMRTFENMMIIGDELESVEIRKRAHDLTKAFYENINNTTTAKVEQSLYLEAALGEKKTVLIGLLKNKLAGIKESGSAIEKTAEDLKPIATGVHKVPMGDLAGFILSLLEKYVEQLKANGAFKDVWRAMQEEINSKYRAPLNELSVALKNITPQRNLSENVQYMRAIRKLPLSPETLKKIDRDLELADGISQRLLNLNNSDEGLKVILDVWLLLSPEQRKAQIGGTSRMLYNALVSYSDEEIMSIRDNKSWNPMKMGLRKILTTVISYVGVEKIYESVFPAISDQLPKQFESSIKREVVLMPEMIRDKIKSTMNERREFIEDLLIGTNYRQFFVDLSVKWGRAALYGGKSSAVGFERDRYLVARSADKTKVTFRPDRSVPENSTTASVLGASLSLAEERLKKVSEFEGTTFESPGYYTLVMEVLNKIPALGGFKKIDDEMYPSFHILKGNQRPFDRPLDLKTYSESKDFFAVPDHIALNPPYKMNRGRTMNYGVQFSVESQAELLRGMASMIEYFRDWQINGFDVRMSQFRLGELIPDLPSHLERELLFPKDKLFEFTLGIASVILENLKRDGSGLMLMGNDGTIYPGEKLKDAKEAQTLMAAMVNVGLESRSDTVRSRDLAKFTLAMAEFVDAMEGFESSRSQIIRSKSKDGRMIADKIKESISMIKLLMALNANFLVHKMQRPDGTIDSNYSLKLQRVTTSSRNLLDQVLVIQALIATGDRLHMGSYLGKAYDIYFGLNHVFLSEANGFYSSNDRNHGKADFYTVTETLRALNQLTRKSDFSRGQLPQIIQHIQRQLLQ